VRNERFPILWRGLNRLPVHRVDPVVDDASPIAQISAPVFCCVQPDIKAASIMITIIFISSSSSLLSLWFSYA
jgi:hypothetical protein